MSVVRRTLASIAVAALAGAPATAFAVDGEAATGEVTVRQAIRAELSPTGEVDSARVFTQLTSGSAGAVVLPAQSTSDLRNLSGFGSPGVDGDAVTWHFDAPGSRRSVADHVADLPVAIEVVHELDGEVVDPADLVGRSGTVTITYRVANTTAMEQELTYKDAQGNERTDAAEVSVPLVGSLSTVLDGRFRDVEAPGGVLAGDGSGNTVVNFSLLLFPPLGDATAEVSVTAQVEDAIVAPVTVQILPVNSDSFASLATAEETYRRAAGDVYRLTQGAMQIDRNLLRLATGLSTLLDGVTQLADGSAELAGGLGDAATGSQELAAGMGDARDGGDQLDAGLVDLATGAKDLSDGLAAARAGGDQLDEGLGRLATGAEDLRAGLKQARGGGDRLDDGLVELAGGAGQVLGGLQVLKDGINHPTEGLPALRGGIGLITGGVTKMIAGLGSDTTADTLLFGTKSLSDGIADVVKPGVQSLGSGATTMISGVESMLPALQAIIDLSADPTIDAHAQGVKDGLGSTSQPATILGGLKGIEVGAGQLAAGLGSVPADCATAAANAAAETASPLGKPTVLTALALIRCGLSNPAALDPADPGFNPTCESSASKQPCGLLEALTVTSGGLGQLDAGVAAAIASLNAGLGSTDVEGETLLYGMGRLSAGADEASAGMSDLADGLGQLHDGSKELASGAGDASEGAGELADGLGQLDDGAGQLADGADAASDGMSDLSDGLGQLDEGASQLADGLVSAEDGASRIAGGLATVRIGTNQAASGAHELNERGTSVLVSNVNDTAASTDLTLAKVRAADERGRTDALPYGTVDGAVTTVVYQLALAGIGAEPGPGQGVRIVTAAGGFGLAGGIGLLARRRFNLG